ncbi:MAG: hypothetical protein Q7S57_00065 [bacterium]|nr:hypothetical protein [bacterium]
MFCKIERSYVQGMIDAALAARHAFYELRVQDATSKSTAAVEKIKGDTLNLDGVAETAAVGELRRLDRDATILTEERGTDNNPFLIDGPTTVAGAKTFFCCDPFDRSKPAQDFLVNCGLAGPRVGNIARDPKTTALWEEKYSGPMSITGPVTAITCVRRGLPIGSVIVNHFSQEIVVACPAGIFIKTLPEDPTDYVDLNNIICSGRRLSFCQPHRDRMKFVATFIGKPERGYPDNFAKCRLIEDAELKNYLHYDNCGGPARVLYLSDLQPSEQSVGLIVANGEKISEWIHWISFLRCANHHEDASAPALRLFEVTQQNSNFIDNMPMMPPIDYSIFTYLDPRHHTVTHIDAAKLQSLGNPSRYRATLVLVPFDNDWALTQVEKFGFREICLYKVQG